MAEPFDAEAKAWMEKSWRDLEMAHRAVAGTPPFYDMAVYHCQQSGEKAVNAFLVLRGISFEKTHDIEVLIELASGIEPGFGELMDAADMLTPYATRFRYPNATFAIEPLPIEFAEALGHAKNIYNFVLKLLPSRVRP
jgi:HEPN domain-containing protein